MSTYLTDGRVIYSEDSELKEIEAAKSKGKNPEYGVYSHVGRTRPGRIKQYATSGITSDIFCEEHNGVDWVAMLNESHREELLGRCIKGFMQQAHHLWKIPGIYTENEKIIKHSLGWP